MGCDFYGTRCSFIILLNLSTHFIKMLLGYVMLYNFKQGLHSLLWVLGEISTKKNLVYISSAATWHVLIVFIAYTYCLVEHELNPVKYWLSALGWLF